MQYPAISVNQVMKSENKGRKTQQRAGLIFLWIVLILSNMRRTVSLEQNNLHAVFPSILIEESTNFSDPCRYVAGRDYKQNRATLDVASGVSGGVGGCVDYTIWHR